MIELNAISKTYITKKTTVKALDNINFNINEGDVFGILGHNGSGKSTLINIMTGLIKQDSGTVRINHKTISDGSSYRKQFSVVYQRNGPDFYLNIYNNLKVHGMLYGLKGKELKHRIEEMLELFDLKQYKDYKVNEVSGGYARRIQCAKALMIDAPVYLFDEPTTGMDIVMKNILFNEIDKKSNHGKTVIFTTQQLEEVEKICNKIIILNHGTIFTEGSISEIKEQFSDINTLTIKASTLNNRVVEHINRYIEDITNMQNCKLDIDATKGIITLTASNATSFMLAFIKYLDQMIEIKEYSMRKATLEEIMIKIHEGNHLNAK